MRISDTNINISEPKIKEVISEYAKTHIPRNARVFSRKGKSNKSEVKIIYDPMSVHYNSFIEYAFAKYDYSPEFDDMADSIVFFIAFESGECHKDIGRIVRAFIDIAKQYRLLTFYFTSYIYSNNTSIHFIKPLALELICDFSKGERVDKNVYSEQYMIVHRNVL